MTNYSKEITGSVTSVHISNNGDISKELTETIQVEFDGIVADKHRSYMRGTYEGESVPVGTVRRNDRQWSAVSLEELAKIQEAMELKTTLTAVTLNANLCFLNCQKEVSYVFLRVQYSWLRITIHHAVICQKR